jgi:hypothetical protein
MSAIEKIANDQVPYSHEFAPHRTNGTQGRVRVLGDRFAVFCSVANRRITYWKRKEDSKFDFKPLSTQMLSGDQ